MSARAELLARPSIAQQALSSVLGFVEFMRLLRAKPVGLLGFLGIVGFALLAFVVPLFVPVEHTVDVTRIYQAPSLAHPLGTDSSGRDVWNQIVHGGRDILTIGFLAGAFSTLIAVTFGAIAATVGGKLDGLIGGITNVVLTIPPFPLLVVLAALLRLQDLIFVAVILALLAWPSLLRQVRAQVLTLRERDYVEAARSLDLGLAHVIFREILPNMRSYIAIHFILGMTVAVYAVAGLIFLGIVPLSGNNWGIMINFAYVRGAIFFKDSFWYIFSPILAIALFQLALVSFASALEDIFNPRLRSQG
ncbi:MAG: ABC transporter permease [Candidatus Limnocylindria bacterium]